MNFSTTFEHQRIGPPISEEDVNKLEKHLAITLPEDYRRFLVDWNGIGFLERVVYPSQPVDAVNRSPSWEAWKPDLVLSPMHGISELQILLGTHGDDVGGMSLWNSNEVFDFGKFAGPEFLSIGQGRHPGDQLCLCVSGDRVGEVLEWTYPEEDPVLGVNAPDPSLFGWVAEDFSTFWSLLRPISDDEWAQWA